MTRVIRREKLLTLIENNRGPEGLDLTDAIFIGDAEIADETDKDEIFGNPIDLSPEELKKAADTYRAENPGSDPPWSDESNHLQLSGALLQRASFARAKLSGASFRDAHLDGVNFVAADLEKADFARADLSGARFANDLDTAKANLSGAILREAILKDVRLKEISLYDVASLEGAFWQDALLGNTNMRRELLGKKIGEEHQAKQEPNADAFDHAKEAYLLLKKNFNQIGRYEDASWAFVKERQMEKMASLREAWEHGLKFWRAWSPFRRWLRNWVYELAIGYGERPWRPVMLGGIIIGAFALGFWLTGAVSAGRPQWFTSSNPGDIDWTGLGDAVTYSLATFATFNLDRTALNPEGRIVEVASSIEALLGIGVLALVVFTLGNRMGRG